jgi:hypothetical protein
VNLRHYDWKRDFVQTAPIWAIYCLASYATSVGMFMWSHTAAGGSMAAWPTLLILLPLWYPGLYLLWVNLLVVPIYLGVVRPPRRQVIMAILLVILAIPSAIIGYREL